jgi:membrane protein DedA with SNARE-associated domain
MAPVQNFLDAIAAHPGALGYALLGAAACLEYVFPPFPGDLIAVFGAFLVTRRGWSPWLVFGAALLGSIAGFMGDYAVGRALARSERRWTGRLGRARPRIDALLARFERHGALYISINRFLPSVRAFFFVAAGMARLSPWRVLGWGALSAAAWNAALFALGATVGHSWDDLRATADAYGEIAVLGMLVIVAGLAVRWWWRRRGVNVR